MPRRGSCGPSQGPYPVAPRVVIGLPLSPSTACHSRCTGHPSPLALSGLLMRASSSRSSEQMVVWPADVRQTGFVSVELSLEMTARAGGLGWWVDCWWREGEGVRWSRLSAAHRLVQSRFFASSQTWRVEAVGIRMVDCLASA